MSDPITDQRPRSVAAIVTGSALLIVYAIAFFVVLADCTLTTAIPAIRTIVGFIHVEPMRIERFARRPTVPGQSQKSANYELSLSGPTAGPTIEIRDFAKGSADLLKENGLWHPGAQIECAYLKSHWRPSVEINLRNDGLLALLIGLIAGFHGAAYVFLGRIGYKWVIFDIRTAWAPHPLNGSWRSRVCIPAGLFALASLILILDGSSHLLLRLTPASALLSLGLYLVFALNGFLTFAALVSDRP